MNQHFSNRILLKNLPKNLSDDDLYNFFSAIYPIERAYIIRDCHSQKTNGLGFVDFKIKKDALAMVKLAKISINGKRVLVFAYKHNIKIKKQKKVGMSSSSFKRNDKKKIKNGEKAKFENSSGCKKPNKDMLSKKSLENKKSERFGENELVLINENISGIGSNKFVCPYRNYHFRKGPKYNIKASFMLEKYFGKAGNL